MKCIHVCCRFVAAIVLLVVLFFLNCVSFFLT